MPGFYDFVTPRLATGAAPVTKEYVQELLQAGITHILDVTDQFDDTSLLAETPQVAYCYNPTADDGTPKPVAWFAKSLNFALPAFPTPATRVYAHCSAGRNRGPSTAYAILRALGWTPTEAMGLIKTFRPQATVIYAGDADKAVTALGYV